MTNNKKVVVLPQAFTEMTLHAMRHSHATIHGLLLGTVQADRLTVQDAVPVCHGAPTRPLVETVLGLVPQKEIVGWYTAPALLEDTKPGPVALKMVASLVPDQKTENVTLLVMNNMALATALKAGGKPEDILVALGKDLGDQWLEPLPLSLEKDAWKSVQDAVEKGVKINDFVDHLEGDDFAPWFVRK